MRDGQIPELVVKGDSHHVLSRRPGLGAAQDNFLEADLPLPISISLITRSCATLKHSAVSFVHGIRAFWRQPTAA